MKICLECGNNAKHIDYNLGICNECWENQKPKMLRLLKAHLQKGKEV